MLHDEKVYTARNIRRILVEIKAAEPSAIGFWKKKCNLKIELKKYGVAELQMYTGYCASMEDFAQYLSN